MKVAHVNYSDSSGGASRAAYRIHQALRRYGVDSQMNVVRASADDWTVKACQSRWGSKIDGLRGRLAGCATGLLRTENRIMHTPALLPSRWPGLLDRSVADVIHLHWIGQEMMSVADVGKLRGSIVWTLHDMWAFAGAEHFTEDFRWRDGYQRGNRPSYESGFDLNRWTWQRKLKHWRKPMHIVASSRWLADCVSKSPLMQGWPVTLIPLAIDSDVWRPTARNSARTILGLPTDKPLLLFGAMGGTLDPRKGFDLLRNALEHLRGEIKGLELVIFGQCAPRDPIDLGFPTHFAGHLHDDVAMSLYYSAADAVVVPSRQESFSNVCGESQACGTPTVVFDTTALSNIVEHGKTGYLARPFDTLDLARGIQWVLDGSERRAMLGRLSRQAAVDKFSYPVVARQYLELYESVCAS